MTVTGTPVAPGRVAKRRVIAETEAKTPVCNGLYVGFTVYEVTHVPQSPDESFIDALGGETITYEVVVRNRTYDGIQVASQWDSEPVALEADTTKAAIAEGTGHANALRNYFRSLEDD